MPPPAAARDTGWAAFLRPRTPSSSFVAIPTTYGGLRSSPPPGVVVGIVLGSVGGFLFLLFLLYSCFNIGTPIAVFSFFGPRGRSDVEYEETETVEDEVSARRGRSERRHRHRQKPPPRDDVYESSRTQTRERVVETRTMSQPPPRRQSQMPPRGAPPPRRVPGGDEVVDDSEDEVVVYEEHDGPPGRRSRRSSQRRRRESGYHDVDPSQFGGGGDVPMRSMSRRRSNSRRP